MQNVKMRLTVGLFLLGSAIAQAAPTADLPPAPPVSESAMQQHIQKMVEEDYAWEAKKREVANELELERMKSEIRKLCGEDKMPLMAQPASIPATVSATQSSSASPHILLESNIGGLSRVAVVSADGSDLRYVSPGEHFTLDGHQYQLVRDKSSGLTIKEAGR